MGAGVWNPVLSGFKAPANYTRMHTSHQGKRNFSLNVDSGKDLEGSGFQVLGPRLYTCANSKMPLLVRNQ